MLNFPKSGLKFSVLADFSIKERTRPVIKEKREDSSHYKREDSSHYKREKRGLVPL